jgi:hypothetical protein
VSRYLEGGLKSRKRGPRISPRRTPKEVEELVIGYRKRFKTIGQERIRLMLLKDHNISLSTRTINRILNAHNLIQKRRKKPQEEEQEIQGISEGIGGLGIRHEGSSGHPASNS